MEEKNQLKFFIIKRLDNEGKSQSLSKIYDLSIFNETKDENKNNNSLGTEKEEVINYNKKENFLKVIKKAILSTNLYLKWKSERIKQKLFSSHIYSLISLSLIIITQKKFSNNNETRKEKFINYSNISFSNISFSNSTNFTITNQFDTYSEIINLLLSRKISFFEIIHIFFFNNIGLFPIWILYFWKLRPKWNTINNFIYKLSNYILLCESYENDKYSYCLLQDYSILVEKKEPFKKVEKSLTNQHLEYIYSPEKNIFLYIISVIYDYDFKALSSVDYYKLLSSEDLSCIIILLQYMKDCFENKMIILCKKILSPCLLVCLINFCYINNFDLS